MLVFAALVVTAVLAIASGLGLQIAHAIQCEVAKVLQLGGCSGGNVYPVSATTKTIGYQGRVAIVDGGHSYTLTLTKYSDGSAKISLQNTGTLGVSARIGAQADLGKLGLDAHASAGGGVYGQGSAEWTFPDGATADKYWSKIASGNSLGLAGHDAFASSPLGLFPGATGLFDNITGAQGAPGSGSLPKQHLTSTGTGGGLQGSANASAGADLGPLASADLKAAINAQGGFEHINSGPDKGDWRGSVKLSGNADGSLSEALFGSHVGGSPSIDGTVTVTFGPNGQPLRLSVEANGQGVWDAAGPSGPQLPRHLALGSSQSGGNSGAGNGSAGSSSGGQSSSTSGGGGSSGSSSRAPVLSSEPSGGSGAGSSFVGQLDLSQNPTAAGDVTAVLSGDVSKVGALVNDMNTQGTEYVQSYHVDQSSSSYGLEVNAGAGGGAHLNDGSSTKTYGPPRVRQSNGQWQTVPGWTGSP